MIITEKKYIKIDRTCKENPVFVSWINEKGGREHWLFHKVQTVGLDTFSKGDFEPYQEDIENSRGQIVDFGKLAVPKLVVNAYVSIEDVEGIKTLLYSPCVEMLMNPLTFNNTNTPPIWQTIVPNAGSVKLYATNELNTIIEITFSRPYINNQDF